MRDIDGRSLAVRLPLTGSEDELDNPVEDAKWDAGSPATGIRQNRTLYRRRFARVAYTPLALIRGNSEIT